jgi:hypothetical protein
LSEIERLGVIPTTPMRVFLAANGYLTPIGTCAPEHILSASRGIHPPANPVRRVATTPTGWKTCTDSDVTTDPATIERAVVVSARQDAKTLPDWSPAAVPDTRRRRDGFYDAMDALSRAVRPHDRTDAITALQVAFLTLHDRIAALEHRLGTGAEP